MATHTPGPWRVQSPLGTWIATIGDPYGHGEMHVADVRGWSHLYGKGACALTEWKAIAIQHANARLIAAAPELLAALKEFVEWHGAAHSADCPADDTCDCIGGAINARVNAAIANAEGR